MSWLHWVVVMMSLCSLAQNVTSSCCKHSGTTVDCNSCHLEDIPVSEMDGRTTELDLRNNKLTGVPNNAFDNFTCLTHLNLLDNPIQELHSDSFKGLSSLQQLEIGSIHLNTTRPKKFPVEVFHRVTNLTHLKFFYIYKGNEPVLQYLTKLVHLEMTMARDAILGEEFVNLKNLKSLHVYGRGPRGLWIVTNQTFANIPDIETLHLTLSVHSITPNALQGLNNLKTLGLPCNRRLKITDVIEAIENQLGPTIETLILDDVIGLTTLQSGKKRVHSDFLDLKNTFFDSPNFARLTRLTMRNTHIQEVDLQALYNLPDLQYFSIAFNSPLHLDDKKDFTSELQHLNNMALEVFDLDNFFNADERLFRQLYCRHLSKPEDFFKTLPKYIVQPTLLPVHNKTITIKPHERVEDQLLHNIPMSVQSIYYDNVPIALRFAHPIEVNNDNNVIYMDLSNLRIKIKHSPFFPLISGLDKLQGISISHTNIAEFDPEQFHKLPSLKYANLAHNHLHDRQVSTILSAGTKLQYLDLSYNNFSHVPMNALENLTALEYLSFSGAKLEGILLTLCNNINLKILDISNCSLQTLSNYFMDQLDCLQSKIAHTLKLNISHNNFVCTCGLAKWFEETKVEVIGKEEINCTLSAANFPLNMMDPLVGCHSALKHPPTTAPPTTEEPTTVAPTTVERTTVAPTTVAPTTVEPNTLEPTPSAPTTASPTTVAPTTASPTTVAPTTAAHTSMVTTDTMAEDYTISTPPYDTNTTLHANVTVINNANHWASKQLEIITPITICLLLFILSLIMYIFRKRLSTLVNNSRARFINWTQNEHDEIPLQP